MDLLDSLQIVLARGSISEGPQSQIVHVSHDLPFVLEGDLFAFLEEVVLILGLSVGSAQSAEVSK